MPRTHDTMSESWDQGLQESTLPLPPRGLLSATTLSDGCTNCPFAVCQYIGKDFCLLSTDNLNHVERRTDEARVFRARGYQ